MAESYLYVLILIYCSRACFQGTEYDHFWDLNSHLLGLLIT